jgi:hypothetical protein
MLIRPGRNGSREMERDSDAVVMVGVLLSVVDGEPVVVGLEENVGDVVNVAEGESSSEEDSELVSDKELVNDVE